jgi:hypothetical protein
MKPLDLTIAPPRSPYEELDGLIFLPRTIDKLRALLPGGDSGSYFMNGQIQGMSGYLLERLGIAEADLLAAVAAAAADDEVAAWVRSHTDASRYAEISATIRKIKPKHTADPAYFAGIYAETLALYPELERVLDIIEADDRRLFGTKGR